ncbi:MAG: glycosyltransferase family 4 protein [Gammaproteobacteria bacterium]|nr:glycosyltransferase family 4 protein [Gammaproteobacteria bacterium]
MHVVHVETGRFFYGGARQACYLIDALAARGFKNTVVCPPRSAIASALASSAAMVVEWPLAGDADWRLYSRLKDSLRRDPPDLVHVHSRRGADLYAGRAARAAGVPALLTRRVQSAEPKFWLRFKCRPYRAVVAISDAVRAELAAANAATALHRIASAVDIERFECSEHAKRAARGRLEAAFELPRDALIAATAAQFIARKGHDFLLPLAARLCAEQPRFRLLLFGRGPRQRRIERQIDALGLAGRVIVAGFRDDWPDLVGGLDLLLHPARREGLGTAVLEAMSAGVAVVAAGIGGIVDVVTDGIDGRLLPPADAAAWHQAVTTLLNEPEERKRLAAAARHNVEARFTIERMTDAYVALYRDVVTELRSGVSESGWAANV